MVTHKKEFAPVRAVREYGAVLASYVSDDAARDAASLARLLSLDPGSKRCVFFDFFFFFVFIFLQKKKKKVHQCEPDTSFAWILDDYLIYIKATSIVRHAPASRRLPTLSINIQ